MPYRRIWVRRPYASPTLVKVDEDDLVDDVRDAILQRYANSLGRTLDVADLTLRIVSRMDHRDERALSPDEVVCRTLDAHYPGGQTLDEALIIYVPQDSIMRPSPSTEHIQQPVEDLRPQESGVDYFTSTSHSLQPMLPSTAPRNHARSTSVLHTGQAPALPSPRIGRYGAEREHRPAYGRMHPTAPVALSSRPRMESSTSVQIYGAPAPALSSLHTPLAAEAPGQARPSLSAKPSSSRPLDLAMRDYAREQRNTRDSRTDEHSSQAAALTRRPGTRDTDVSQRRRVTTLESPVPSISVLIVEDNPVTLRVLMKQMEKLEVRWDTATNGQIAVEKWKAGGYHLLFMDILMPVMDGLQATKEIRRLERVNEIGIVSTSSTSNAKALITQQAIRSINGTGEPSESHSPEDGMLLEKDQLFKSPVIIVALTASSLESDRHEALTAGCNDFLTKPVNNEWLERKVREWGCMQALIDFEGWRKWDRESGKGPTAPA